MIRIENWTRIDNLEFNLNSEFEYIREEAELLGEVEEWEVYQKVEEILEKDFPQLFTTLRYDDVVDVEYYPFERDYGDDPDEFPGYAVYISFQRDLTSKLYKHVLNKHPDYVVSHLKWMERL